MKMHLASDPDDPALTDEEDSAYTYCGRFVRVPNVTTDFDKADCSQCAKAEENKKPVGIRVMEIATCDDCPMLTNIAGWNECQHPGAPTDQLPEAGKLSGTPVWCPLRLTPIQIKKAC